MKEMLRKKSQTKFLKLMSFIVASVQFVLQTAGRLISPFIVTVAGPLIIPSSLISIYNSYKRLQVIDSKEKPTEKLRLMGQIAADSLKLLIGTLSLVLLLTVQFTAYQAPELLLNLVASYIFPGILLVGVTYRLGWAIEKNLQARQSGNKVWADLRDKKALSAFVAFGMYAVTLGLGFAALAFPHVKAAVHLAGYVSTGVSAIILTIWTVYQYKRWRSIENQLELEITKPSSSKNDGEEETNGIEDRPRLKLSSSPRFIDNYLDQDGTRSNTFLTNDLSSSVKLS